MDITHDNSRRKLMQISAIVGTENLPDYVVDYTVPDYKIASALQDELFADPGKRLFPVDSKGATWMSAAYAAFNYPDRVATKYAGACMQSIMKAADAWGIRDDVDKAVAAIDAYHGNVKCAEDDDANYGWCIRNQNGDVVRRRYPMFDAEGVRKAAMFFSENRKHYPSDVRKEIAGNILTKAAQHQVADDELPDCVSREAGRGIPRRTVIMRELNERAKLAKSADFAVLMANVTRLIGSAGEAEVVESMDKLAAMIDAFDQAEGLVQHYGSRITYPSDFLCSVTIKDAQAFVDSNVTLRRFTFDVEKLASLPPSVFEAVLGDDFTHSVMGEQDKSGKTASATIDTARLRIALTKLSAADKDALETHLVSLYGSD